MPPFKSDIFVDIETYHDFFYVGFKRASDGLRRGVEFSTRNPGYDREFVRTVFYRNRTIGYNSLSYDLPMIWLSLEDGITNERLKAASDAIIKGGIKPWQVEEFLGIRIPYEVKQRHIDLIEPQPNAFASLKTLNGRMHGARLQDLPYHPDTYPTPEQMDHIADYCLVSDLDATESLWKTLQEPMDLRAALSEEYGRDFMSKSDSQIGEAIVKMEVEKRTGFRAEKAEVEVGAKFRYPVPAYVRFQKPELCDMLERLRETVFEIDYKGKVELPAWLNGFQVTMGQSTYQMGIGGLHSTEANRAVLSDETRVLVDADVASQYPSIITSLGLYPKALGPIFLEVYDGIKKGRLSAKARAKEIKRILPSFDDPDVVAGLKKELARCNVIDKGAKIQLNGVYGKLGSTYSALYAPHLLISVTLTGQLTLLMLIEAAEAAGIPVVSANTDGVLFHVPRAKYNGLLPDKPDRMAPSELCEITDYWEKTTGFNLEFGEYKAIYNQSVNTYYALKPSGGHKRKGPIANPWNPHSDDFDPVRGQLMKNPQATICSDAALLRIKEGIPVEKTIKVCRDIKQFITVIRASKGATWRGEYLGKTVRYYWGIDGSEVLEVEANAQGNFKKVPKSDGAVECMNLPEQFPGDIDYARYVQEAEDILWDVGFYGPRPEPIKAIRWTKANTRALTAAYSASLLT